MYSWTKCHVVQYTDSDIFGESFTLHPKSQQKLRHSQKTNILTATTQISYNTLHKFMSTDVKKSD